MILINYFMFNRLKYFLDLMLNHYHYKALECLENQYE